MEFNEQQLAMAEKYGSALREIKFLAEAIEVDFTELKKEFKKPASPIRKRYSKGFEMRMLELSEATLKAALRGSNPALNMMMNIAQQTQLNNL
jgi:hypothetical protein